MKEWIAAKLLAANNGGSQTANISGRRRAGQFAWLFAAMCLFYCSAPFILSYEGLIEAKEILSITGTTWIIFGIVLEEWEKIRPHPEVRWSQTLVDSMHGAGFRLLYLGLLLEVLAAAAGKAIDYYPRTTSIVAGALSIVAAFYIWASAWAAEREDLRAAPEGAGIAR